MRAAHFLGRAPPGRNFWYPDRKLRSPQAPRRKPGAAGLLRQTGEGNKIFEKVSSLSGSVAKARGPGPASAGRRGGRSFHKEGQVHTDLDDDDPLAVGFRDCYDGPDSLSSQHPARHLALNPETRCLEPLGRGRPFLPQPAGDFAGVTTAGCTRSGREHHAVSSSTSQSAG